MAPFPLPFSVFLSTNFSFPHHLLPSFSSHSLPSLASLVHLLEKPSSSTPHLIDTTYQQVSFKQVIRLQSCRTTQSCCISYQPLPIKSRAFSRPTSQCLLPRCKSINQCHGVLPRGLRRHDETCRECYDKTSREVSVVTEYTYTRAKRSEHERHIKVRDTPLEQDIC